MDITLLPPTSILSQHSHQIYLPSQSTSLPAMSTLLPSAMPRHSPRRYSSFASSTYPRSYSYRSKRRSFEPSPPPPGISPFSNLPDELVLEIFSFLEWEDLLSIRPTNRKFSELALSPCLHSSLTLLSLPPDPIPPLLEKRILPNIKHLHLHLFPYPSPLNSSHPSNVLLSVLEAIPSSQLKSLSLPFSAPYLPANDLGMILRRIGGKLEKLDLRGSGVTGGRWLEWIAEVGTSGKGLLELDLGFTAISNLPIPQSESEGGSIDFAMKLQGAFRNLTRLSLASCAGLSSTTLASFLANLPPSIEYLDLSRLEQVSFPALWGMRVVYPSLAESSLSHCDMIHEEEPPRPTGLRELKLVGIDHLTRQDIRRLKAHWEEQRKSCFPQELLSSPQFSHSKMRVWGEPHTPPNPPIDIPEREGTPAGTEMTPVNSTSSNGTASSSTSIRTPITTNIARIMPWMSPPEGLWNSRSKLPNHPYLPSPSYPNANPSPMSTLENMPKTPPSLNTVFCGSGKGSMEKPKVLINIVHSAILESEDEAGYRQFIGEVVGGTVIPPSMDHNGGDVNGGGLGLGLGLGGWQGGLGFDVEEQGGQMPVEVDGGSWM